MNKKNQSGMFIIFAGLILMSIILLIGLALDVGRALITSRNLQALADSAALAGVQRLRKCDPSIPASTPLNFDCSFYGGLPDEGAGGWQAVKPAVKYILENAKFPGGKISYIVFSSSPTRCDIVDAIDNFGNLQFETGTSSTDATIKVERLFECLNNSGNVTLRSLEQSSYNPPLNQYHYCLANAVRVTIAHTGHKNMFAALFSASSTMPITRSAVARVRPTSGVNMCLIPNCSLADSSTQICFPGASTC